MAEHADIAIVGAGAAGLMAAIWAGRTARRHRCGLRIVALDGARRLGAKILLAGGGRCNVTHDMVDAAAYHGSTTAAIRKVLRAFDVPPTVEFFRKLGVRLKREETGKLFPVTDNASTVLDALLRAAREAGVELRHPARVEAIHRTEAFRLSAATPRPRPGAQVERGDSVTAEGGRATVFRLTGPFGVLDAAGVILATGGKSLPETGSDGFGYDLARRLGHSLTPRLLPALVPLVLNESCFIRRLSGLTVPATLEVRSPSGKRLATATDSTLCTHFGLSGPSVLNISRHYLHAVADDPAARLFINWLPGEPPPSFEAILIEQAARSGAMSAAGFLETATPSRSRSGSIRLPQRFAQALCEHAGVDPITPLRALTRAHRRALAAAATNLPLPVTGHRGFEHSEVTAGGVPLRELRLETMESRVCPGMYLCGEICDVDGPIGGYNLQWAWSSGRVAGAAAAVAPRGQR